MRRLHSLGRLVVVALLATPLGCEMGTLPPESPPAGGPQGAAASTAAPGGIEFIRGYVRGYQYAQQAGKPMLVFFTAQWCDYCHQMQDEAFVDPEVVQLARQFVCVLVDADEEPEVCEEFGVNGFPTVQFISPRGVPLNRLTSKTSGDMLRRQMLAALDAVASRVKLESVKRR